MRYALRIWFAYQLNELLIEETGGESECTEATFANMRDHINDQIRCIDLLVHENNIPRLENENDFERYEYTSSEETDEEEEDVE